MEADFEPPPGLEADFEPPPGPWAGG